METKSLNTASAVDNRNTLYLNKLQIIIKI